MDFLSTLASTQIIPVVIIHNAEHAVPLAETYLAAGIKAIEITLRTDAALSAIESVAKHVPGMLCAAGTVTTPEQMQQVVNAGAQFSVSPGLTRPLCTKAQQLKHDFLPGIATPSDILRAKEFHLNAVKFFPAGLYGGVKALQAFSSVFPDMHFCPTGGVSIENMRDYLAIPNVICIGGSWLAPKDLIAEKNWSAIERLCTETINQLNKTQQ